MKLIEVIENTVNNNRTGFIWCQWPYRTNSDAVFAVSDRDVKGTTLDMFCATDDLYTWLALNSDDYQTQEKGDPIVYDVNTMYTDVVIYFSNRRKERSAMLADANDYDAYREQLLKDHYGIIEEQFNDMIQNNSQV